MSMPTYEAMKARALAMREHYERLLAVDYSSTVPAKDVLSQLNAVLTPETPDKPNLGNP